MVVVFSESRQRLDQLDPDLDVRFMQLGGLDSISVFYPIIYYYKPMQTEVDSAGFHS